MNNDLLTQVQYDVMNEQKHRDGIPQIAVGVFLALVALFMIADKTSFVGIYIVFIPLIIRRLRKKYTYPRIGYAKLIDKEQQRGILQWLILGVLALMAVVFFITRKGTLPPSIVGKIHIWLMGGIAAVVVLMMVFRYIKEKNKIFLFYGAFILALIAAILYFHLSKALVHYIILGFGALNLIYGIIMLKAFIKKYPVLENEDK